MPRSTVEKIPLSASTNGRRIKVVAGGTPGTLIHTAVNTVGVRDWITLYAHNNDSGVAKLTIEWGGTTDPDDYIEDNIDPESGEVLMIAGEPLDGGLIIRAFATVANKITISGYVERVTSQ